MTGRSILARLERGPRAPRPGPLFTARDLALLAGLWVAGRALIWGAAALAGATATPPVGPGTALIRWDARWYVEIATTGYHPAPAAWESGDGTNWPFFPLTALAIAGARRLSGWTPETAGLVVAQASSAAGLALFFLYAREIWGRRFARAAAPVFAVWPLAVHQAAPMSESVFAPLLLLTLWLARRGAFGGAGAAAAALSAARAPGAFVAFPLLVLAARRHALWRVLTVAPGTEPAVAMLAACGLGAAGFALYLHALTGDALAFTHAQVAWGREPTAPWMTALDALNPVLGGWTGVAYGAFNLAALAAGLALARELVRLRLGADALYAALIAAIALGAGSTMSVPRFLGALAPLALPVAWAIWRKPRRRTRALAASAALMVGATWAWCRESLFLM